MKSDRLVCRECGCKLEQWTDSVLPLRLDDGSELVADAIAGGALKLPAWVRIRYVGPNGTPQITATYKLQGDL